MSQFDFATIDPNAKSGTQLAVDLNNWRDALHSGHRAASRPAYAQGGMLWVRETSAEQWDLMFYDGDTDFVLRSVNPTTNQLIKIPQDALEIGSAATLNFGTGADDLPKRSQSDDLYQGKDSTLTALAGLSTGADKLPYFTGVDAAALATLTAFGRSLIASADPEAARTTLGARPLGDGQSWQTVTRTFGTTYTNTAGRTIAVSIVYTASGGTTGSMLIDGVERGVASTVQASSHRSGIFILIPHGSTYSFSAPNISSFVWSELR